MLLTRLTIYFALFSCASGCNGYLNLPQQESATNSGLSGSALHFSNTVFPILSQHCSTCHGVNQPPLIAFKSDAQKSYDNLISVAGLVDFVTPDNSRIVQKVRGGHNCWGSCADNADEILTAVQNWKDLDTPSNTNSQIQTSSLVVPSTITTSVSATMTFNLNNLSTGIPADAKLLLTIQKFDNFTYLVTNPRVVTSVSFHLRSLNLWLNGVEARPGSTYSLIESSVPISTTASPYRLSTSSLLINIGLGLPLDASGLPTGGPGVDQIRLGFIELSAITTPQQQRFLNMQSMLRQQCAGCHGGTTNSQNGIVPAFSTYTKESDYLNRSLGAGRLLIRPGDSANSALYRSVAHLDGVAGHVYSEIARAMPPPPNNDPTRNAIARAGYADTIKIWIDQYTP